MNRALLREVAAGVLQTAVLSVLTLAATSYVGHELAPYGTVGLVAVLVLTGHVYRRLRQPTPLPPAPPQNPGFDRPFARFAVVRERLRWGVTSPTHFAAALRPMLIELADDRLRRRHGIDRRRQPEKARALLGEPLWRLMTETAGDAAAPPTVATLDALVRRIEEL